MKRRHVLGSIGLAASGSLLGYASRETGETVRVRVFRSERAGTHDSLLRNVTAVLDVAFDLPFWELDVSDGGVVAIDREHAASAVTSGEWPSLVGRGVIGSGSVEPVWDVNLLVTAGRMDEGPTGYGLPHVAAVGGAQHISKLDPAAVGTRPVSLSRPTFSAHVLVHEVGHALGLAHDHGAVYRTDGASVATPMLSTYAWSDDFDLTRSCCCEPYPPAGTSSDTERRLQFRFSECARKHLRTYSGDHLP